MHFVFAQTNLVLKLNQYLLTYWIAFDTVYLHLYLLTFDILGIFDLPRRLSSAPTLFYKTSKVFNIKMSLLSFIFHESFLPVNGKIIPDVIILCNLYIYPVPVQKPHSSLHVRRNFWCLMMTLN